MKNSELHTDPGLDVILGRDVECLSLAASVGLAFIGCLVVAAAVASGLIDGQWAFGLMLVVVAAIGWWTSPARAVVVALIGFLFTNGFLVDSAGTLAWHGEDDIVRLVVMVCLGLIAALLGRLRVQHRSGDTANSAPRIPAGH